MTYKINLDLDNIITVSPTQPVSLSDIRLNQVYRVVADPNVIDETGKNKIIEMTQQINLRDPIWEGKLPAGYDAYDYNNGFRNRIAKFPDDWAWVNVVTDKKSEAGKYGTGKFAKRWRSYVQKQQGLNLPEKFIQDLGQVAGRYSDQSTGTVLRFVDEFDWNAGDFGDPHSCFWGGREEARVMLKDQGAWAVQLFTPESIDAGEPKGFARMWVVRNFPQNGIWTMFNGYGYGLGEPSLVISRLVASLIGDNRFREIKLGNHDSDSGTLYINSGNGFVIGTPKHDLEKYYDFEWPERAYATCCHCGENLQEEDDPFYHRDRHYCESCRNEYVQYDELARDDFDVDYEGCVTIHTRNSRGVMITIEVSERSANRYATECAHCGDHYATDVLIYVETSGNSYCPDCAEDHVGYCHHCNSDHEISELTDYEDEMLCDVCLQDAKDNEVVDDEEEVEEEFEEVE